LAGLPVSPAANEAEVEGGIAALCLSGGVDAGAVVGCGGGTGGGRLGSTAEVVAVAGEEEIVVVGGGTEGRTGIDGGGEGVRVRARWCDAKVAAAAALAAAAAAFAALGVSVGAAPGEEGPRRSGVEGRGCAGVVVTVGMVDIRLAGFRVRGIRGDGGVDFNV